MGVVVHVTLTPPPHHPPTRRLSSSDLIIRFHLSWQLSALRITSLSRVSCTPPPCFPNWRKNGIFRGELRSLRGIAACVCAGSRLIGSTPSAENGDLISPVVGLLFSFTFGSAAHVAGGVRSCVPGIFSCIVSVRGLFHPKSGVRARLPSAPLNTPPSVKK